MTLRPHVCCKIINNTSLLRQDAFIIQQMDYKNVQCLDLFVVDETRICSTLA